MPLHAKKVSQPQSTEALAAPSTAIATLPTPKPTTNPFPSYVKAWMYRAHTPLIGKLCQSFLPPQFS